MPSTFFGLNIGTSALTAFQASINTTANNISNVQTEGYSRQKTTLEATQALRVTARYGSTGTGVAATSITQERDKYFDTKYWANASSLGFYEQKTYFLSQVEDLLEDNGEKEGFTTIFSKMFNALDSLKNNAGNRSTRNQFINQAQVLCTYFNSLATSFSSLQTDINEEIKSQVNNINAISEKVAMLNKEINTIEVRGGHANELRDERAKLFDELSKMVNLEVRETPVTNSNGDALGGTNCVVVINGQVLVDGNDYNALTCVSHDYKNNQNDISGLYDVVWADTGMSFAAATPSAGGTLKSLYELRDGNNETQMVGKITASSTTSFTIKLDQPWNVNAISLAENGQITINNRKYEYNGWSGEVDDQGQLTSVTLKLVEEIAPEYITSDVFQGKVCYVGESVPGMGVPYYQSQINEFLREFTELFNDWEKTGATLDGQKMGAFFVASNPTGTVYEFDGWLQDTEGNFLMAEEGEKYTIYSQGNKKNPASDTYYQLTAANVAVNSKSLHDPAYFATTVSVVNGQDAYDIVEELKKLQSGVTIFRGDNASSFLETLISDIAVDTEKSSIFEKTYANLEVAINNQRTSVSGVDEDEEALNLIKFQNAYNIASKVISVMNEMYNKLINETGV